jgi:hypothetical protein
LWIALFRLATTLWSSAALETPSFGSLDVMTWDPFLVVLLGASRDSGTFVVRDDGANIDLLDWSLLAASLPLLWEIWDNPDVVEEVADTDGTSKEEQVQEETAAC